jgi:hypothetical protein
MHGAGEEEKKSAKKNLEIIDTAKLYCMALPYFDLRRLPETHSFLDDYYLSYALE